MNNAARFGYTFEVIRGYKFQKGNIFKEYIGKLYQLRLQYSKDNPLNLICKLLMNSLYAAKPGMKTTKSVIEMFDTTDEFDRQLLSDILDTYGETLQDYIKIDNHLITIRADVNNFTFSERNDMYHGLDVNIAIASAVTAGGRMWMSQIKNNPKYNLYYSDTDSAVIDAKLDNAFVGSELGQFKLEYEINRAVFLAPKVYGLHTSDGKVDISPGKRNCN